MDAAGEEVGVEEIDSPDQRVVARRKMFFVAPIIGAGVALVILVWGVVRQNLPAHVVQHWPWRLQLLDFEAVATVFTVLVVAVLTRMQYAETVRPVLGWTLTTPSEGFATQLPIKREGLLVVDAFNGGHGVAVVDCVEYRIALVDQREHSGWLQHHQLYQALEEHGIRQNETIHFAYLRRGFPLQPGHSLLDRNIFLLLVTRDTLKAFRILDIRLRFRDQVGDLHERVLACRAVFTWDLAPPTDALRQRAQVPAQRASLLSALLSIKRR